MLSMYIKSKYVLGKVRGKKEKKKYNLVNNARVLTGMLSQTIGAE